MILSEPPRGDGAVGDREPDLRQAVTGLQELLVMSMLMLDRHDVDGVVDVLGRSVEAVTGCRLVLVTFRRDQGWTSWPPGSPAATSPAPGGGAILEEHGAAWRCSTSVSALSGSPGLLVVESTTRPGVDKLFVIERLGHLLGAALVDAELHERDHRRAAELDSANAELARTLSALRHREAVQDEFIHLAATGTELDLAASLSRLTDRAVVLRDRFAHETARVASDDQSQGSGHDDPLVAVIGGRAEFGTVELQMPFAAGECTENAIFALQYASVALGLIRARAVALTEMENRLGRDLLVDLVDGIPAEVAVHRAAAQGHDLRVRHDLLVTMWSSDPRARAEDRDVDRVRTALARQRLPFLVARNQGMVVALAHRGVDTARLYDELCRAYGHVDGVVARGESITSPEHIPRAYEQAQRALRARQQSSQPRGCVDYSHLGVERILALDDNAGEIERLIDDWLADLMGYDERHGTDLVTTLATFLDLGGTWDQSAVALSIHRNTLRYRLRRITEISGHDLTDVDTRLNVHLALRAWRLRRAPTR